MKTFHGVHDGLARRLAAGMAVLAVLAGCAAPPQAVREAASTTGQPTFYPALPNAPRIQHLTTVATERDVAGVKDGFANFILGEDKEAQRLTQPYGVAMHRGKMYVADTGAAGVAVFDLARQRFEFLGGSGGGRMKRPINIRVDTDGTKYITDTGRDQVLVYDSADRYVGAFGTKDQFRPVDLAISGDRLYVVDIQHHQIQVLDKRSGAVLFSFGKVGSGDGELYHPTNIALGPDGDVYVVETSNYRVQRFTAEGKPVRTYGTVGSTVGTFARPKGLAMDRQGRMYVGDAAFQNVQIFDPEGRLLLYFGDTENAAEALNLPAGVTIDYDNVAAFRKYARPDFNVEYLILVASQFGPNKVDVFGFGRMRGAQYPDDPPSTAAR